MHYLQGFLLPFQKQKTGFKVPLRDAHKLNGEISDDSSFFLIWYDATIQF